MSITKENAAIVTFEEFDAIFERTKKLLAFSMHVAKVSASFRHGISTVNLMPSVTYPFYLRQGQREGSRALLSQLSHSNRCAESRIDTLSNIGQGLYSRL